MIDKKKLLLKVTKLPGNFFKEGHGWFRLVFNEKAGKDKQPLYKGDGCAIWVIDEKKQEEKKQEEVDIMYDDIIAWS